MKSFLLLDEESGQIVARIIANDRLGAVRGAVRWLGHDLDHHSIVDDLGELELIFQV